MWQTSDAKAILWMDLETTGSALDEDDIIEVGAILTDFDYVAIASMQAVVKPSQHAFDRMIAHDVVREMHIKNGLINEITTGVSHIRDIRDVDKQIVDFVRARFPTGKVILAGSGVGHFDRKFIDAQLWETAELLKYPTLDIGVVRRFFRYAGITLDPLTSPSEIKSHRAFEDIVQHLNEARTWRDLIKDLNKEGH